MRSFFIVFCLSIGFFTHSFSQEQFTINGNMRDADTGEELLYATIAVKEIGVGATTNLYGFYSLTLPVGKYTLEYAYIGYQPKLFEVDLKENVKINIELMSTAKQLEEVLVTAEKDNENLTKVETGTANLNIKEIKLLPVIFGEQDVIKTLQLLPGVSSGGEGSTGFYVRGGNLDQNLILLDEATVYNASHLLGFFSVFNSDALKEVKLYKGSIPAQYGGRGSSVLDIRMKDGNSKRWAVSGGLGLISSRLTVEGPIVKDKGSIILSGRRTYADVLARAFYKDFGDSQLYFYDLNLKANYKFGEKDRVFVSGYFGKDKFGQDDFAFDWGNATATVRWNHLFSDKVFSNTSLIYSDFDYSFQIGNSGSSLALDAGIIDYNFKQDFTYYINPGNSLRFGLSSVYHNFIPGAFVSEESPDNSFSVAEQYALESGLYASNEQIITDKFSLKYGLRVSMFNNIGLADVHNYNENNEVVSTVSYGDGEFYNTYIGLEPRLAAVYKLNETTSVKASYNRNYQYLHLLSNSNTGTPTDLWIPSTPLTKPEIVDQVSLGYYKNLKDNRYEFSVEGYYKDLQNQVDYENGADIFLNENIESQLVYGVGKSYGIEFLLKKKQGRFTGWLAYTLSQTEKQFDEINNGEWFSARQDRTHDISLVTIYQLSKRWTLSAAWVYNTGDAATFPSSKYEIDGSIINLYSERNGYRMPDYHRLDLGATLQMKNTKRFKSELSFSIYNTYNRKNAYSITFRESETIPNTSEAVKLSLYGMIPSITWNFSF